MGGIAHFPRMIAYVRSFYGMPSTLMYQSGTRLFAISSEEGVQQGDPLGPFAFALAVHSLFLKAKAALDSRGCFKAYLDDASISGEAANVASSIRVMVENGPRYGYVINPRKSRVLLASGLSEEEKRARIVAYSAAFGISVEECQRSGIFISAEEGKLADYGIVLLGNPLGSKEFIRRWLNLKMAELRKEAEEIVSFPDAQGGWLFLYYCLQMIPHFLLRLGMVLQNILKDCMCI